jgi:hypothetical protein
VKGARLCSLFVARATAPTPSMAEAEGAAAPACDAALTADGVPELLSAAHVVSGEWLVSNRDHMVS